MVRYMSDPMGITSGKKTDEINQYVKDGLIIGNQYAYGTLVQKLDKFAMFRIDTPLGSYVHTVNYFDIYQKKHSKNE